MKSRENEWRENASRRTFYMESDHMLCRTPLKEEKEGKKTRGVFLWGRTYLTFLT